VIEYPDGRRVHAIVEPTNWSAPPSREELDAYVRTRLTAYKVPKTYEFLERLPRTDAGKLNRNALAGERA
jgi:bile acid-coenzyme A ligase